MKTLIILTIAILIGNICSSQVKNTEGYMSFYQPTEDVKVFKMGKEKYVDQLLKDKSVFDGKDFFTKIRTYSWGKTDTSYYRADTENFYHFNPKLKIESVVLPKQIILGQTWFEADSSWSYKVIGIDEKLSTPARKYTGVLVIECLQITGRDKEKQNAYQIYYAERFGMVASFNNGKLGSYLLETKPVESLKMQ